MTIVPGNFNFIIYAGNTLGITFTWRDNAGQLVDLTDYSALLECRYNLTDTSPFLTITPTLGGVAGTITIEASTGDTSTLTPGIGIYDLQMTDPSGNVFTLLQGVVTVQEMVTR